MPEALPNGASAAPGEATVIGAGIVGICCALYLQRDGWQVTVVDPRPPGEGCSYGNAGIQAHDVVPPIATPGILWQVPSMLRDPLGPLAIRWSYLPRLAPWLWRFVRASHPNRVEAATVALASLLREVPGAYRPLLEGAGATDLVRRTGALQLFETEAGFKAAMADVELRRRHGARVDVLGPEEIRQVEPGLAPVFKGGVYRPEVDYVRNPLHLTQMLANHFRQRGGRILEQAARRIETRRGRPHRVLVDGGEIGSDTVVIATGAWSRPLAANVGVRVPLDTERGYHVMLPSPGVEPRLPINASEGGFYLTPMEHGLRIAGTVELAGLAAAPNYARADVMLERARRYYPSLNEAGAQRWMGFRPSMPDSLPVISPVPGKDGIFLAFGHGHLGLTLGAITGRLVAKMAAGRDAEIDMTPFRADRFTLLRRPF